jgi:serine protease Do
MPNNLLLEKIFTSLALSLLLIACSPSNQAQTRQEAAPAAPSAPSAPSAAMLLPDFTTLVEKEGPAVVNISTTQTVRGEDFMPQFPGLSPDDPFYEFFHRFMPPREGPREYQTRSLGSGFIISEDGYILTNTHVIDDADEVTVKLTDKREFKAKVVGTDRRTDVALIKIDAKGLPKVPIGDPNKLRVGEWVAAIGSPFGFENSVTVGIVSAKGRSLPDESYVPFIQTDAAVNPGNSGGPLFNLKGEVVGINSQIYSRTGGYMGLAFAIPIDVASNVADQLRKHGKVTRGRLGIGIQELTPDLAASFGLKGANGVLVSAVEKGGPAEKAGLQPGDVILKYDGKSLQSASELPRLVGGTRPGTAVRLQIWRKKAAQEVTVVVGELPAEKTAERRGPDRPGASRFGLVVSELTAERQRQLNVDHGLLVENVRGSAAKAGIRRGDVILAVGNTEIATVEQFVRLLNQVPAGQTVALLVRRGDNALYIPLKISP